MHNAEAHQFTDVNLDQPFHEPKERETGGCIPSKTKDFETKENRVLPFMYETLDFNLSRKEFLPGTIPLVDENMRLSSLNFALSQ